ncbi:hypothetical protein Dimus_018701 [Dionaea muscipula]
MLRSPKKRKMKRSTSGKGVEAEPESKKSSAPRATKELDIPNTELPRSELVLTSGKRNIVPTKVKDKDIPKGAQVPIKEEFPGEQLCGVEQDSSASAFNSPVQANPSIQDLARAERQAPWGAERLTPAVASSFCTFFESPSEAGKTGTPVASTSGSSNSISAS